LHTSASGSTAHAAYAECGYDDLRAKQYDYWALGHIHQRGRVWDDPRIHFSGNVQGRHIRETKAKGCLIVTVYDQQQADIRFEPLDVLRWERCLVDATDADDGYVVVESTSRALAELVAASNGRPIAARVEVVGACRAHEKLAADPLPWTNEIRGVVHDLGRGNVWIEKVKFQTSLPRDSDLALADEGPVGELVQFIAELRQDPAALAELGGVLADLSRKLPGEFKDLDDFLRLDDPQALVPLLDQVQPLLVGRLFDRTSTQRR
jgi:DNA repair exonuclease SbcCD nuclease subunit